ncbi:class I adenylate-forming enzyme family protein [Bosea sp. 124]|uniref:class I adenylate-forming enzyme family protein n=1 Tax=Bosea sp. 124 TaxID=2135642 RepID=UPI000D3B7FCD|nr:class I adenylate-forming enzyme family protein [Bosea sp. 124]PTM43462.1 fatty-acyl-CoA synthase [Bosea sp. 124]
MPDTFCYGNEFATLVQRFGDRIAVEDVTGTITYRALGTKAAALGLAVTQAGIAHGQPVASFVRNGIPAVWTSIGIVMSGAAEVALNPGLSEADLRYCVELAGIRHVVTTRAQAGLFETLGARVHCIEEIGTAAFGLGSFPRARREDWARIGFTSGTTGPPKGIVTNQGGRFAANLLQRAAMPHKPGRKSRLLLMTPFSHGAGLLTYAYLDLGGAVTLLDGVDTDLVLGILERGEADEMFAPPTVLAKIVAAAEGRRLPGLKTIYCGTATLSPTLYARARAIFGPVIRVTYGKTEVVNPITVLEPPETDAWYAEGGTDADACVGWPATGVEVVIRTDDDRQAAPGDVGEILLRGHQMMAGTITTGGRYEPLPPDGFHETGDLGYLDTQGRLHLSGRSANMIKTGGYKVAPEEIERPLAAALGGGEIVAFGVPSEYWGEVIVAVAERPQPGWEAKLAGAVAAMTSYKRPRALLAFEDLPRNAMLKVSHNAARQHVLATHELIDGPHPRLVPRTP